MTFLADLGSLGLPHRLKALSDRLMQDGIKIYRDSGLAFEPRWVPLYRYLDQQGPSPVMGVARGLGTSHPAVIQVAREMANAGFVANYRDARDKRRRLLALTSAGKAIKPELQALWRVMQKALEQVLDDSGSPFLTELAALESVLAERGLHARMVAAEAPGQVPADLQVEDFTPALAGVFRAINEAWIREYFVVEAADLKSLDDPLGTIIHPGGAILFVRDRRSAEILGTCALINHGEGLGELAKMGVHSHARGRGAGELLVRSIIARARSRGFEQLFLETNKRLGPAIRLYEAAGFVHQAAPRASDYQRADVYMSLDLTVPG